MGTWKLVSGILSIVLFAIVAFQSCAAGLVDALESSDGTSGAAGAIVGILLLAGGIVSIASRDGQHRGLDITLAILFGLAAFVGYTSYGIYSDLLVWSTWCLICAALALVSFAKGRKSK